MPVGGRICTEDEGKRRWRESKIEWWNFARSLKLYPKMYLTETSVRCSWLQMGTGQEEKKNQLLNGLLESFGVLVTLSS